MSRTTLGVWKFASCDGCQLTLLDCADELLTLAGQVEIATFAEASSAMVGGPYDVSLVEGSITTRHDEQRIREIREQSKLLDHHRCLCDGRGSAGAAQLRRRRRIYLGRLCQAGVHRHARDLHAGVGARRG